ncbi:ABC transporter ATP-binding protein [Lachnospiraceae bacterium 42-17]|nr:ABC transporter ATP-binding protein [Dorea sp.]
MGNKIVQEKENVPVLSVEELSVSFNMYQKGLRRENLEVLHKLSLSIHAGEILAVAGASGSGKSILAHAVLGILPGNASTRGRMLYKGQPLTEKEKRRLRGREIAFIPQSVDYLDPLMRVGRQVMGVRGTKERQRELFGKYGLEEGTEKKFPSMLSGGMARRVLIASALMEEASLIVADEPTPGLSKELAEETLQNFRELADAGCAVILITHDIDLAFRAADKIAVFYAGTIVEIAPAKDFRAGKEALRHPYSRAFLEALPQNEFRPLKGFQPYAGKLPKGCLFAERCSERSGMCMGEIPMRKVRGAEVRCVHAR